MNDCPNAEIRDRLPDLLHDRLDVSMRAAVMAHVDDCVDCRAELELLKGIRGVMIAQTPRVDINYVVNALPKQYAKAARVAPRHRTWADWRIAAAVTVLAVGGGSVAVMNRAASTGAVAVTQPSVATRPIVDSTAAVPESTTRSSETLSRSAVPSAGQTVAVAEEVASKTGLAPATGVSDLNERQLRTLLDEIDRLQAVPMTEPEPVTIRIDSKSASSPEGA